MSDKSTQTMKVTVHDGQSAQMLEKLISFVGTVRVMRENQRNYFKTRTRKSLQESMALEKKVDHLLAEMAGGQRG